ncbi:MAG: AMP-binding protein, partial [Candidatus Eisenbacteria bacterium]|nr:AMP-binding protein [Candidatus Eisenbacteria bacterium]
GRAGPSLAIHGDGSSPTIPPRGLDRFFDRLVWKPIRDRFGGRLRYVVSGSAPLSTADALWFCGIGLPMLEGYGLTEAGPVVSVNTFGAWRVGSVGRPLPGLEVRIAEDGEILVRSPSVMPSYHNLPAESEGALRDGWLHTGDLGRLDDDSFLWITGRKKDLIVTSGGKNIAPQTIEDRLRRSPLIAEAAVFGDRRPYLVALILPDWEALATQLGPRALDHARAVSSPLHPDPELRALLRREIDRCSADLAAHERIRAFALMREPPSLESGTMTPTLKIRRPELEAEYAEALAALYEQRRV